MTNSAIMGRRCHRHLCGTLLARSPSFSVAAVCLFVLNWPPVCPFCHPRNCFLHWKVFSRTQRETWTHHKLINTEDTGNLLVWCCFNLLWRRPQMLLWSPWSGTVYIPTPIILFFFFNYILIYKWLQVFAHPALNVSHTHCLLSLKAVLSLSCISSLILLERVMLPLTLLKLNIVPSTSQENISVISSVQFSQNQNNKLYENQFVDL